MPQQRTFQQEAQLRTDEQADYPANALKRVQREFDAANPPVTGPDPRETRTNPGDDPRTVYRQKANLRTSEQDPTQSEIAKRYTDA